MGSAGDGGSRLPLGSVGVTRTASLRRIAAAYGVALVVALGWLLVGPATGHLWPDALVADLLATLVVFCFSRAHKNSSFYDAYWSVAPPLLLGSGGWRPTRRVRPGVPSWWRSWSWCGRFG